MILVCVPTRTLPTPLKQCCEVFWIHVLNIVRVEGVTRCYFLNGGTKLEKIALIYPKTFVHRYRRLVGTIAQLGNTKSGRGGGGGWGVTVIILPVTSFPCATLPISERDR